MRNVFYPLKNQFLKKFAKSIYEMWQKNLWILLYASKLTWTAVVSRNARLENVPQNYCHSIIGASADTVFNAAASSSNAFPFLRLNTPSGKIYYVTKFAIIACNPKPEEENYSSSLPFITYGSLHGKKYAIHSTPLEHPTLSIMHGRSNLNADRIIRLMSFVGLDKKRYRIVDHRKRRSITESVQVQDELVDYLEIVFSLKREVFVLTFAGDGSELTDMRNCTESVFLTITLPSGGVGSFHQFVHGGEQIALDLVTDTSSSPYITFNHVDGAKYDIRFPLNGDDTYNQPTIMKDESVQRNKCVANELFNFVGPDKKRYSVDVKGAKVMESEELNESGKIGLNFGISNELAYNYELTVDGDVEGVEIDMRFGENDKPQKPSGNQSIDFKCLQSCIG